MLRDRINEALREALRNKDSRVVGALRLIIAKMKDLDIAARSKGNMDGISDSEIQSMMQGMIKQRRESIALYEKGNRPDLAEQESGEIAVIERFLPKQMSSGEVETAIEKAIAATGAASVKDMGKIMAALKENYAGQMDFSAAGAIVKKKLSS